MKQSDLLSLAGSLSLMILSSIVFISCANTSEKYCGTAEATGGEESARKEYRSSLRDSLVDPVSIDYPKKNAVDVEPPPLPVPQETVQIDIPLPQHFATINGGTANPSNDNLARIVPDGSSSDPIVYPIEAGNIAFSLNYDFDDSYDIDDVEIEEESKPIPVRTENAFRGVEFSPLSTFSIDVDAASYSNTRGYLTRGSLPPVDAVRIEELVNYFKYDYEEPHDEHPFSFATEVSDCPWNAEHKLVRIALQGREVHPDKTLPSNIVFLIDVSGSMNENNKLPLLKESFYKLVDAMGAEDHVAIVVYAGAAGLVLESTPGSEKEKIKEAIKNLQSGGSTAGGAGITLAYDVAKANFLKEGNNRVILATDGDFNVGVSSQDGLVKLIEEKRAEGVYLSVLGFGDGNYQDAKMEQLADNGNGNYYYVDRLDEGERILVSELSGTLYTIAKDVKLQIEFNTEKVVAYRLLGYENRMLTARQFDDDRKDAGELGAGHSVTAFYEVVLKGANVGYDVDTTKQEDYRLPESRPDLFTLNDLMIARLRYKNPKDSVSNLVEHLVLDERKPIEKASDEFRFATAVVEWGLLLRQSDYVGESSYNQVINLAASAIGSDEKGYRKEFIELVEKSRELSVKELSTR